MRNDITPEDIRWWIQNSPREWKISAVAVAVMMAYLILQIVTSL